MVTRPFRGAVWWFLGWSLLHATAVSGEAPAGRPSHPGDAKSVVTFLERYLHQAPGAKIAVREETGGPCPPGFRIVRYRLDSTRASFDVDSALLLTEDGKAIFLGHALPIGDDVPNALGPGGQERLSKFFSNQAGASMSVRWESRPGPGGSRAARVLLKAPMGEVESPGAVSSDGRWFLFGAFFPLDADPREERSKRLGPAGRPSLGPVGAPVTIIELTDYQCPNCADLQPTLDAMVTKYPGRVRLVHFDLPQWQAHEWAFKAALWGRCVARLSPGAFWGFRRELYYRQRDLTGSNFDEMMGSTIAGLGIGHVAFMECARSEGELDGLLKDLARASSAGISATPTVLVNGRLLDVEIASQLPLVVEEALQESSGRKRGKG
jgi:protein-disulfide isomerase